jgi:hypothetical protein
MLRAPQYCPLLLAWTSAASSNANSVNFHDNPASAAVISAAKGLAILPGGSVICPRHEHCGLGRIAQLVEQRTENSNLTHFTPVFHIACHTHKTVDFIGVFSLIGRFSSCSKKPHS